MGACKNRCPAGGIFVVAALLGAVTSHADDDGVVIRVVGPTGAVPARCQILVPGAIGAPD
jgi:hypothetical protein